MKFTMFIIKTLGYVNDVSAEREKKKVLKRLVHFHKFDGDVETLTLLKPVAVRLSYT